jgi:hypothetical protein
MERSLRLRVGCAALTLALGLFGCSSEPDSQTLPNGSTGAVCPPGSPLSYEGFATTFFTSYCTRCHSTANVGTARRGAPAGYDWDDLASIAAHAREIDAAAAAGPRGTNEVMPPGDPRPTGAERSQLGQWLACEFGN